MSTLVNVTMVAAASAACGGPRDARDGADGTVPARIEVAVGDRPLDVIAGDVDGDGAIDLLTANVGDDTISVRLQREGAWIAGPGDPIAADFQPHLIALGDVDRDGDLDLVATAHDSGAVAVWLGDGAGGFTAAVGSPFTAFAVARPHNHGLVVGDLDGDGDADVVVADQEQRAAAVLLGDGGGLTEALQSPVALGAQTYPPALGDLDGDGRLDLVAPLIGGAAIAVLLGDGAGGFAHALGSPHRTARARPYAIVLAHLDHDGALDVIVAHDDTDDVSVLLGDGTGRLRLAPGSPVSLGLRVWRGTATDVDGDGALDLVAAGSGSLVVARGDGRGGLARPELERLGEGWTAIAADLDGDGRPDLAAPDSDTDVVRIWPARARD